MPTSRGRIWPSWSIVTPSASASRLGTDVPPVTFTDTGDIAAYALPAVQALQRAGVISGMPDGSFRPREHMTREQACVVLSAL